MATLRDVAKRAGVSLSTASRALNGTPGRPDARRTRERVLAAVRDLDYIPNDAAQRLGRNGKLEGVQGGEIGVILGNVSYKFADPFWSAVLEGVDREATRNNYHIRFTFTLDDLLHERQVALLDRTHIDGLILIGGHDSLAAIDRAARWLQSPESQARTVIIEGGDERFMRARPLVYDVVTFEKRYPVAHIVEHLAQLGRRHLAFIGPGSQIDERGAAFLQSLAANELPFDPGLYVACPWATEQVYDLARDLLMRGRPIDAVVCGCDAFAVSTMRAARDLGLRLPEDLAITGFDDISFAKDTHPPLTTVRVDKEMVGVVATQRLLERLRQPQLPRIVQMVPSVFVARESCGEASHR